MKIAYYGNPASNTEVAAIAYFGTEPHNMKPCRYYIDVFSAIKEGFDYGIVPIYNSTEGLVTPTCDLIFNIPTAKIVGEHIAKIENLLLAPPGTELKETKTVFSHPQPLLQCSIRLEGMGVDQIPLTSTSAAAEKVAKDGRRDQAAIANSRAAQVYGLEILKPPGFKDEWLANNPLNYTKFWIIANEATQNPDANKTTITFVLHQGAGQLHQALYCFKKNDIDLLFITSRPLPDPRKPEDVWKNYFYVDCAASSRSRNLQNALHLLRTHATMVRDHGSYLKAKMPI